METIQNKIKTEESRKTWKRVLSLVVRVTLSALVLYFIFSLVQWQNVLTAYQAADGQYILIGGLLLFANLGVRIMKWHIMLHSVKDTPTLWEAIGSVLLGITLGSFTPGEVGEFAGRVPPYNRRKATSFIGFGSSG